MIVPKPIMFGEWLPDMPQFGNPGSINVRGCYPKSPESYGPMPGASLILPATGTGVALTRTCQGAFAVQDNLSNIYIFAGDAKDLYLLDAATSYQWTIVSKTTGGYNCPTLAQWNFQYFNGIVIATNGVDAPQQFTLGSSTKFSNLASGAPSGKYCASVQGFLMMANTFDSVNGQESQWAWWSGFNNPTSWPTPGTQAAAEVQSSFNALYGAWGNITGVVGNLGGISGALFMQRAVFQIVYVGPPSVFSFIPVEGVKGCIAPGSIIQVGAVVYYLAEDGWRVFDGANSQLLANNKFDITFFNDLDRNNIGNITGAVDPIRKLLWWAYPGAGNLNGNPNRIIVYNWDLHRGAILDITCEVLTRGMSLGYTLDQLYTVLGYSLDTLPAPLDSPLWSGGSLFIGWFDTSHRLNAPTSQTNMLATFDTAIIEPNPGFLTLIDSARPIVDATGATVNIGSMDTLQKTISFTGAVGIDSTIGNCPTRTNGRYIQVEMIIPAGQTWNDAQGVVLNTIRQGQR